MFERKKSHRPGRSLLLALLACGVGLGWYWNQPGADAPTYQLATVTRGELTQVVTASGQLNPVVKVEVGSQISGFVEKLSADFNSPVKAGELIAQIDPAAYEASLIQADGNLSNARAALELVQVNANRARALQADKLISQSEFDKALADLHQAEAVVKINEGSLKKARVDLARCSIYAPIDGVVISRNINVGQTVAASLSSPTLFVIANDLAKMQIEAKVAEADIGRIDVGQPVNFTVDAFPGQAFRGQVMQVRNAPNIEQNVVTYDTIIAVDNPNLKLKPGMTANVAIVIAHRDSALKIPGAALRFRPPANAELKVAEAPPPGGNAGATTEKPAGRSGHKKDRRKADRTVYVMVGRSKPGDGVSGGTLQPVQIKTGASDGTYQEVLDGVTEGTEVVVALNTTKEAARPGASLFGSARRKH